MLEVRIRMKDIGEHIIRSLFPDIFNNTKRRKIKPNTKINVTLRFNKELNSYKNDSAVQDYNDKHPKTRNRIKDYLLLDCIMAMRDIKTYCILRSFKIRPEK